MARSLRRARRLTEQSDAGREFATRKRAEAGATTELGEEANRDVCRLPDVTQDQPGASLELMTRFGDGDPRPRVDRESVDPSSRDSGIRLAGESRFSVRSRAGSELDSVAACVPRAEQFPVAKLQGANPRGEQVLEATAARANRPAGMRRSDALERRFRNPSTTRESQSVEGPGARRDLHVRLALVVGRQGEARRSRWTGLVHSHARTRVRALEYREEEATEERNGTVATHRRHPTAQATRSDHAMVHRGVTKNRSE